MYKYHKLTVTDEIIKVPYYSKSRNKTDYTTYYVCKCDCGNIVKNKLSNLRTGKVKSCGCHNKLQTKLRSQTHGMSRSAEHVVWCSIKTRCYNPNYKQYKDYGGRGITMSDEWLNSFETFLQDMGTKPPNSSIERINNNGPYSKDNCVWATRIRQANNTRKNHILVHNEMSMTVAQWSLHLNLPQTVILDRINKLHWDIDRALTTPVDKRFSR